MRKSLVVVESPAKAKNIEVPRKGIKSRLDGPCWDLPRANWCRVDNGYEPTYIMSGHGGHYPGSQGRGQR